MWTRSSVCPPILRSSMRQSWEAYRPASCRTRDALPEGASQRQERRACGGVVEDPGRALPTPPVVLSYSMPWLLVRDTEHARPSGHLPAGCARPPAGSPSLASPPPLWLSSLPDPASCSLTVPVTISLPSCYSPVS